MAGTLDQLKTAEAVLNRARETWPGAVLRTARKVSHCDNAVCGQPIQQHDRFIDPGENHPYRAGGFGGMRFCLKCGGGEPHV